MAEIWTTWPDWSVGDAGVVRREFGMDGGDVAVTLHHPARPWQRRLGGGLTLDSPLFVPRLQAVVAEYVDSVAAALGFPLPAGAPASAALNLMPGARDPEIGFGWLAEDGGGSERRVGGDDQVFFSLRAGNRWLDDDGAIRPLGGGVALGLDLLAQRREGQWTVQVLGSSSTRPAQWCADPLDRFTRRSIGPGLAGLAASLQAELGLAQAPRFSGLRLRGVAPQHWQAVSGLGALPDGRTLHFEAGLEPGAGGTLQPRLRSRAVLQTHGAPVLTGSPPGASAAQSRPTRGPALLESLRSATTRLPGSGVLQEPAPLGRWRVHRSAAAWRDPAQALLAQPVPASADAGLRSDAQSALHAAIRADEFFRRLDDYGRSTTAAQAPSAKDAVPVTGAPLPLRLVALPLELRPRSPLRGAADGDVVNAEVRVRALTATPALTGHVPMPAVLPSPVELRFGAGRPAHRGSHTGPFGRATAQALGIAADERWAWHEFGHVLVFAATGLVELRFAHGIGDALAVLVTAPDSPLAGQPGDAGSSFPWIGNGRRHDRDARLGWCWCGRRSAWRHAPSGNQAQRAGYFEEQLFSSAMHRAYLALGGGEVDAADAGALARRRLASDYLVYLLMRAVTALPPDTLQPTLAVETLVEAMVTIDLGIQRWRCEASWPEAPAPRLLARAGGRVHKALRWAFEQQGLHAGVVPGTVVEGPATPPVDLYIEDLAGRGGHYTPLPLRWPTADEVELPWMAGDEGLSRNGTLVVTVRNRGREAATGVQVLAWWAPPAADGGPAAWLPLTALTPTQPPATVGGAGSVLSVHFGLPQQGGTAVGGPFWVFAAVSCVADPTSLDDNQPTGSGTPPLDRQDLADLVALDNNCALRRFDA